MDNIPERKQPDLLLDKERRRGVSPFDAGIEMQDDNFIMTKPIVFRDLGKVNLRLFKAHPGDLEWADLEYEERETINIQEAFTIDLSGKITRGKVIDFFRNGYYQVRVDIQHYDKGPRPEGAPDQNLKANIWLENTEPIVSSEFYGGISEDVDERAYFFTSKKSDREDGLRIYTNFMLPNNPEIFQAVRLNIISDEE